MGFKADDFRLEVHRKYSTNSVIDWILQTVRPLKGWSVLDIGCGSGEQLIPIVGEIGRMGHATGIDLSEDAIKSFKAKAAKLRLTNVEEVVGDMDKFETYIPVDSKYELIISNFAIYYAKRLDELMAKASTRLKSSGFLFLTGPAKHNNHAVLQMHETIGGTFPSHFDPDELEVRVLDAVKDHFRRVQTSFFWNPVTFPSADVLVKYWKSYFLYDPRLEGKFAAAAKEYFKQHKTFVTVKEVIGIRASA